MIGAIIGDIIGSVYEFNNILATDFELFSEDSDFTDDSVMSFATAYCLMNNYDYAKAYKEFGRKYPNRGYGGKFAVWLNNDDLGPYNSFGNGSAMRVSPIGFAFKTLEETLNEAKKSAEVTHNHIEGIKGAQSVAAAIFLARNNSSKEEIKSYIENNFGYKLDRTINQVRFENQFDETCQGSVPESIICFLQSNDFEDAIRQSISIGGDSDTIACICGGIAEAFYKHIDKKIIDKTLKILQYDTVKRKHFHEFTDIYNQFKKFCQI